ncbi:HlyU family transcriptional regulator [Shimia sp. NS0008-38b]|uniref:HlyU family transcriptional regulator n=1 Tax=Shimia sp. NS0008-38b TaxID=3127653 RepID=UPI0031090773
MSWLKSLLGGGAPKQESSAPQPLDYKGYRILPTPIEEGGQFRISARIEGTVNGEAKSHTLIRADMIRDLDEANEASIGKAKQMIDQMGDLIF